MSGIPDKPQMLEVVESRTPTAKTVARIVSASIGCSCDSIERFSTGLCHYVFGVHASDGRDFVVRIARPETRSYLQGGVFWSELLRPLDLPLPKLIAYDIDSNTPFMILARLPGQDLGECYNELSASQKHCLANKISHIQKQVASLPEAIGFGYAFSYKDPALAKNQTWLHVLNSQIERARSWMVQSGIGPEEYVRPLEQVVASHRGYFMAVRPTPFLDDTTTKNVLIHRGELSGIVDVDQVCFGDSLMTVALTRMALLARNWDADYIEYWKNTIGIDDAQQKALDVYTALFCVIFMGELGMRFNKETRPEIDRQQLTRYKQILDDLLS